MLHVVDKKLKGHAMVFAGPLEIIEEAKKGNERREFVNVRRNSKWGGSDDFRSWNDVLKALNDGWPEGVAVVQAMLEELRSMKLPQPKSRARKRRHSEEDGDVNCDRWMAGEPAFMSELRRENRRGPTTVALLCNLDGCGSDTPQEVFWRGAAAAAAADLLEANDYQCEIWMWCLGGQVYSYPNAAQFTCCPMKEAGAPLDIDTMVSALSAWFLRVPLFGSFVTAEHPRGYGSMRSELGDWKKYMDISEGVLEIKMPIALTKKMAVEGAVDILNQVIEAYQ